MGQQQLPLKWGKLHSCVEQSLQVRFCKELYKPNNSAAELLKKKQGCKIRGLLLNGFSGTGEALGAALNIQS